MKSSLLALALALTGAAACGGGSSIFDVKMTISNSVPSETRSMVTACEVVVAGSDHADFFLGKSKIPCMDGLTGTDLGTFAYTSSATSGTVSFTVNLLGNNPTAAPIATGTGNGPAHEGSRTAVTVLIE